MSLQELLKASLTKISCDELKRHLNKLVQYDRYQASEGICQAATYIQNYFLSLKRLNVSLHEFSTNTNWWTFAAPLSWTPTQANLSFFSAGKTLFTINHQEQPCSIATNSRPWSSTNPLNKIVVYNPTLADKAFYQNALVIITKSAISLAKILSFIEDAGALGFITDYPCKTIDNCYFPGRIELANNTRLFGFSTTPNIIEKAISSISEACYAVANIEINNSYPMPVLEAFLDLNSNKEIWVVAHLCHPRPGANDNTSGIIGMLEIARILADTYKNISKSGVSVRFILAPEFTGMAAYLHDMVSAKNNRLPEFVINMDMIGENLEKCKSKFYIERPLLSNISYHQCLIEILAQELSNYSYQQNEPWEFCTTNFLGYSDHALFADAELNVPATQLCHFPDIYNHSAGDIIDNVDLEQLKKIISLVLTFIMYLCKFSSKQLEELNEIIKRWINIECQKSIAHNTCDHEQIKNKMAGAILNSYHKLLIDLGIKQHKEIIKVFSESILNNFSDKNLHKVSDPEPKRIIQRKWQGPFNPRAFIYQLTLEKQNYIFSLIESKKIYYSMLLQLGLNINSKKSTYEITQELKLNLKNNFDEQFILTLLEWMFEQEWISQQ